MEAKMTMSLRVLLIEDSEDDALLVVRELSRGGFDVISTRVDTAEALVAALEQDRWDVAVADFTMPRFSGTEALTLLREYSPDMPFIFVSGTIGEDAAVDAMRSGAHDYIMKGQLKRLLPAGAIRGSGRCLRASSSISRSRQVSSSR
jgi:DNA-binding NtrC family response regulator